MHVNVRKRGREGMKEAVSGMKGAVLASVSHWWGEKKREVWRCFDVDQVRGASAWILLPGNWASSWLAACLILKAHCCFLNRSSVGLALRLIRTNVLLLNTDFDGHQSPFDLSCWSGLETVVSAPATDVFVLTPASRRPPMFKRPRVAELYCWQGLWINLWRDLVVKCLRVTCIYGII